MSELLPAGRLPGRFRFELQRQKPPVTPYPSPTGSGYYALRSFRTFPMGHGMPSGWGKRGEGEPHIRIEREKKTISEEGRENSRENSRENKERD
ncbi:MAG TPA: hypothetical protein DCG34_05120 [Clostridiales bacterium]|nr:hypothetical protein [Clostridiales bacterium]